MIIDKIPLPEDPTPAEAPPSYDTLSPSTRRGYPGTGSSKGGPSSPSTSSQSISSTSTSPISPSSPSIPNYKKGKGRAPNNSWFSFTTSRTAREVRTTVLSLVRDLIQEYNTSGDITNVAAHVGILQSCADACAVNDVSLSSILQEKSIENHTPLYWAIVKRLPDEHHDVEAAQGPDLISTLISYAAPLTPETVKEVRSACLATSDQKLFQRLRLTPDFTPVSGKDQMLLGVSMSPDEVEVEELQGDGAMFMVHFVVPHFHKRMVVSKEISLEFIARNRLWRLRFFVSKGEHGLRVVGSYTAAVKAGTWSISLELLDSSPPTYIDSRIVIEDASISRSTSPTVNPTPSSPSRNSFSLSSILSSEEDDSAYRPKPTIELRIYSREQLESKGYNSSPLCVRLEDSLMAANLQYANNAYVSSDDKLRGRFEARLAPPQHDHECIIC
ncbi:hypothetical protein CVT24_011773 [Panaeolus cyanescens]|uniref:Uncharacterized protein n=1 Tax=Panaeolus cyanescens TaxID=181874 RepID=A0A409VHN3_9AGAR|nr:hypothetical protein CVT24_011773 [Panaeolus cyanescens]